MWTEYLRPEESGRSYLNLPGAFFSMLDDDLTLKFTLPPHTGSAWGFLGRHDTYSHDTRY